MEILTQLILHYEDGHVNLHTTALTGMFLIIGEFKWGFVKTAGSRAVRLLEFPLKEI